jgi:general secretion pathway protein H
MFFHSVLTAKAVARAETQTLAVGSKFLSHHMRRQKAFTLIELLVVLTIVAFASGMVVLSIRSSGTAQLTQDADRLIAHLEAARALARTQGTPLRWRSVEKGFVIEPALLSASNAQAIPWLSVNTQSITPSIFLSSEPLIGSQEITLTDASNNQVRMRIKTDGLGPFIRQ